MKTKNSSRFKWYLPLGIILFAVVVSGCASSLQTKVAGNLNALSKDQTVAILPIETSESGQNEMANMFRQGLYANLKQSKFNLLEKYIVDGLLKQNHLTDPSSFLTINPMQFGEMLGADAIVFSRINKVERSYLIVHSSIEISVSVQMIDTRTGEILWRAEQTEHDFSGIGKIPTGITTALLAPIQFVTNKFNLRKMTSTMVDKLTALVKKPENAEKETKFDKPMIAKNATTDLKKIEELQQLKAEWRQALTFDEDIETEFTEIPDKTAIQSDKTYASNFEPPLKAVVRQVQAVESEMSSLPIISQPEEQKAIAPPTLNVMRTTLAAPELVEEPVKLPLKKISPKKRITRKPTPSLGLYTVQVGAYKTKTYAQTLMSKLTKKGYKAFVTQNKKLIYKVQVDKFRNKVSASKFAQQIREKEKLDNFVTLISPGLNKV